MKRMLMTLIAGLFAVTSLAGQYPSDLDLSRASESQIVQVAQADAKDFYARSKSVDLTLNSFEILLYVNGRAVKHNLTAVLQSMEYSNTFNEVMTQLKVDGE